MNSSENAGFTKEKKIIDKHIEIFLSYVRDLGEVSPYSDARKKGPDFPILRIGHEEFFKFSFFEEAIESYIREDLVNPIFSDLFHYYGIISHWPKPDDSIRVNFNNSSTEQVDPFEFLIEQEGKCVGFRYSLLPSEEYLFSLFQDFSNMNLDHIEVIDWDDRGKEDSWLNEWGLLYKYPEKIHAITLKQFFKEYFPADLYAIFVDKLRDALHKADAILGLETIPKLTPQYVAIFKQDEIKTLSNISNYETLVFHGLNKTSFQCSSISFDPGEFSKIKKQFLDDGLYLSLIGKEDFARSFITSEYLMNYFENNICFDYTSVVSGYIKCVEQVIKKVLDINLVERPYNSSNPKWIKKKYTKFTPRKVITRDDPTSKSNSPVKQVAFLNSFESYFDITLGSMIRFLRDYSDNWIVDRKTADQICAVLTNYKNDDRNDHFHKHNISDYEVAKTIRDNTIFVLMLLLGGCNFSDTKEKNIRYLGIPQFSYDKLYLDLKRISKGEFWYEIKFKNQLPVKAVRLKDQDEPVYDKNGLIQSPIRFIKVDQYSENDYELFFYSKPEDANIIIDRNNIPEQVTLMVLSKGTVKKRVPIL